MRMWRPLQRQLQHTRHNPLFPRQPPRPLIFPCLLHRLLPSRQSQQRRRLERYLEKRNHREDPHPRLITSLSSRTLRPSSSSPLINNNPNSSNRPLETREEHLKGRGAGDVVEDEGLMAEREECLRGHRAITMESTSPLLLPSNKVLDLPPLVARHMYRTLLPGLASTFSA